MNRITAVVAALVASTSLCPAGPLNLGLGEPVISFDQNGTTAFDAGTGAFTVRATPLVFFGDSATTFVQNSSLGPAALAIDASVDSAGNLVGSPSGTIRLVGAIDVDGDGTIDLDGVLLEGEASAFGFDDPGGTTDLFDFVFVATGGLLADEFAGQNIGVGLTSEQSDFDGTFTHDFSGGAKGNVGATCLGDITPPDLVCEVLPHTDPVTCPCDIDLDGDLDPGDIAAFGDAFAAGDADFNMDGVTDAQDLEDFLNCTLMPPAGCALAGMTADCCIDADGDKVDIETIVVQYTGQGCDATLTTQDSDKFDCDGDPMQASQVYAVASDEEKVSELDDAEIYFEGTVPLGGTFPISAMVAGRDDLKSKTFVHIFADDSRDTLLQFVEFHTSCSQPLFTGDQFGSLKIVQCVDENGNVAVGGNGNDDGPDRFSVKLSFEASDACTDSLAIHYDARLVTECEEIPVEDCEIVDLICFEPVDLTSADVCDDGIGKPAVLLLQYTGADCSALVTAQDSGKYDCDGDPMGAATVHVVVTEEEKVSELGDADIYFEGAVALGESFEAFAANGGRDEFKSETYVYIFEDASRANLLQFVEFHTSCSQPIRIGDEYGSIRILGVTDKDGNSSGGDQLECGSEIIDGRLVVTASFVRLVVVATDGSGNETVCETVICEPDSDPGDDEDCCANGVKPNALVLRYTGEDCSATNTSQDDGKFVCSGDPAFDAEVYILVSSEDDPDDDKAKIYFEGLVPLDGEFVMSAMNAGEDRFKSETFVYVYSDATRATLIQAVEFHTSCSQPLFTGDQYGSIEIVACGDPNAPISCCEDGNKANELDLLYTGMDCASAANHQDSGKFECSGDTFAEPEVLVLVSSEDDPNDHSAEIYFEGTVTLGEVFTMSAANAGNDSFKSASFVYFFDTSGNLLQAIEFHTSCSQPINIGDSFGGFEIVGCRSN